MQLLNISTDCQVSSRFAFTMYVRWNACLQCLAKIKRVGKELESAHLASHTHSVGVAASTRHRANRLTTSSRHLPRPTGGHSVACHIEGKVRNIGPEHHWESQKANFAACHPTHTSHKNHTRVRCSVCNGAIATSFQGSIKANFLS